VTTRCGVAKDGAGDVCVVERVDTNECVGEVGVRTIRRRCVGPHVLGIMTLCICIGRSHSVLSRPESYQYFYNR
jgi:hypothetical protein